MEVRVKKQWESPKIKTEFSIKKTLGNKSNGNDAGVGKMTGALS